MNDTPQNPEPQEQRVPLYTYCMQQASMGVPVDWRAVAEQLHNATQQAEARILELSGELSAAQDNIAELDGYNRDLEGDLESAHARIPDGY